ncbi:MAG: sigma-70 RNA polymerase sigma factor region 4 domain-containing protein [Lutibacter sp.]
MNDFRELWNNYQAHIRSENVVSAKMQKEFWDVVYPLILADAKKIANEYNATSINDMLIDPIDFAHDGILNLITRIKNNANPLVFKNKSDVKKYAYIILRNLKFSQFKKDKEEQDKYKDYYSEEYDEEFNLKDSLNNIQEFDLLTVFNLFKEKREPCHKLISLVVLNGIDYNRITDENHFIGISLSSLRKMKERCMGYLKDFVNNHYLNLVR